MVPREPVIALEAHLRKCRNVVTLGVRPNFGDYTAAEAARIRGAHKIYYPSSFYAPLLNAAGIATFPSCHTYHCAQDKIRQTALFALTGLPHPRTRVFYGRVAPQQVLAEFELPCVGKIPRGSARGHGVTLIRTVEDLQRYLSNVRPAYVQQYIPSKRDIRVVVIGGQAVLAYWRQPPPGDFRSNLAAGGTILPNAVPEAAVRLAQTAARKCGWDDVGIDICPHPDGFYLLEGNMKYGRAGFEAAGIDYFQLMESFISEGRI